MVGEAQVPGAAAAPGAATAPAASGRRRLAEGSGRLVDRPLHVKLQQETADTVSLGTLLASTAASLSVHMLHVRCTRCTVAL